MEPFYQSMYLHHYTNRLSSCCNTVNVNQTLSMQQHRWERRPDNMQMSCTCTNTNHVAQCTVLTDTFADKKLHTSQIRTKLQMHSSALFNVFFVFKQQQRNVPTKSTPFSLVSRQLCARRLICRLAWSRGVRIFCKDFALAHYVQSRYPYIYMRENTTLVELMGLLTHRLGQCRVQCGGHNG